MKRIAAAGIGLLSALALAAPASAAASEGPSLAWAAVKMVFALGLVLAVLLALSHYSKKYLDRFTGAKVSGKAIAISEVRQAGPKTQIMVIEAFGAKYLLGVTPTEISVIDKVPAGGPEGLA